LLLFFAASFSGDLRFALCHTRFVGVALQKTRDWAQKKPLGDSYWKAESGPAGLSLK